MTNDSDFALSTAIAQRDLGCLGDAIGRLPAHLGSTLKRLCAPGPAAEDSPAWQELARDLARHGYARSADCAFINALVAAATCHDRAMIMAARAGLLRDVGLDADADACGRATRRLLGEGTGEEPVPESSAGSLRTLGIQNDPDAFHHLVGDISSHPLTRDPMRNMDVAKDIWLRADDSPLGAAEDLSFLVLDGETALVHVECDVMGAEVLRCRSVPIVIIPLLSDHPRLEAARDLAARHLSVLCRWAGAPGIWVETAPGLEDASPGLRRWIDERCLWNREVSYGAVDLCRDEDAIFDTFGRTRRYHIRRGLRELEIRQWTPGADEVLDAYFTVKRSIGDYSIYRRDHLQSLLAQGRAHIFAAYRDGGPVSVLVVTDHGDTTAYTASVSVPNPDNIPFSHPLVWLAICDARRRGMKHFDMTELHTDPRFDAKQRGIAQFKMRFLETARVVAWHSLYPESP